MLAEMLTAADQLDTIREIASELYGDRAETVDRFGHGSYEVTNYDFGTFTIYANLLGHLDDDQSTVLRHELAAHVAEYLADPEADPDRIETVKTADPDSTGSFHYESTGVRL
ncbi:hypothetical protein ACPC54_19500 [Kitasatospora sp. NPDC094028]